MILSYPTLPQINRLNRAQAEGRHMQIRTSARQVAKNSYTGGFLDMLASLETRALPTLLMGVATGLLSGGICKAISGSMANVIRCRSVKVMVSIWLPIHHWSAVMDCSRNVVVISAKVLVCSWERIVRLRIFPFWDGYCNYLFRRDVYKNKVLCISSVSLKFIVEQYG